MARIQRAGSRFSAVTECLWHVLAAAQASSRTLNPAADRQFSPALHQAFSSANRCSLSQAPELSHSSLHQTAGECSGNWARHSSADFKGRKRAEESPCHLLGLGRLPLPRLDQTFLLESRFVTEWLTDAWGLTASQGRRRACKLRDSPASREGRTTYRAEGPHEPLPRLRFFLQPVRFPLRKLPVVVGALLLQGGRWLTTYRKGRWR